MDLSQLTTEQTNPASLQIDSLSSFEIAKLMNLEDRKCADAVETQLVEIGRAIDVIADRVRSGGRLFYLGAGTSGRLGVLDASECPPTFNTRPEQVIGIIAGGNKALTTAIEGAEDDLLAAEKDLRSHQFSSKDILVGIASSGRTPYVIGGLDYARSLGAYAIGFSCNGKAKLQEHADLLIAPVVGPEVITGSTRLKSGTATKMVLNMLTTGVMVRLGKTYGNWMVDLRATNLKLIARSIGIVKSLANVSEADAKTALEACDGEVKTAIVTLVRSVQPATARELLTRSQGHLRVALELRAALELRGALES